MVYLQVATAEVRLKPRAMAVLEEIVALMNAYPPLWFLYVLVLVLPFVLVISCLFWPKVSTL